MKSKLYSAFPGCGKTTYFNTTKKNVLDSDSSTFDKRGFPKNYLNHIETNVVDSSVDTILISSHKDVRDGLVKRKLFFNLVYPDRSLKEEYIERYEKRGNNEGFIKLLKENWDNWMDEMEEQEDCNKIVLKSGEFLSDVIDQYFMIAYKLIRKMKDGSLSPLFINRKSRIPIGEWMESEIHPTKGFSVRKGWHCLPKKNAPHLSEKNRVWVEVEVDNYEFFNRPESQGGTWLLAQRMKIIRELD